MITYPLVNVVRTKLHRRVGYYPYAIGSIAGHEPSPAFLPPHFCQCLWYRHLVFLATDTLDLKKNLESLEGRDNSS